MTEFEIMKEALERVYGEIEIEEWKLVNSAVIIVELFEVTIWHWFKDGKLESIDNCINYSNINY